MDGIYSQLKPAWHLDRIQAMRAGFLPAPVHVQLVISDLCNQDCMPAGTAIECPGGFKPIEAIRAGDFVIGADGQPVRVTQIGDRLANEIYEISCAGKTIRCTGEHPVLTADGWKEAKDLTTADSAVVRVRMWDASGEGGAERRPKVQEPMEYPHSRALHEGEGSSIKGAQASRALCERPGWRSAALRLWLRPKNEVEPPSQAMGQLYLRARQNIDHKSIRCLEIGNAARSARRVATAMFMWLRTAGVEAWQWRRELLGQLCANASDAWTPRRAFAGGVASAVGADEAKQPDAQPGGCSQSETDSASRRVAHQDRDSFLGVGQAQQAVDQLSGQREALGEPTQSGLSSRWPEEGHRDRDRRDLQWRGGRTTFGKRLWRAIRGSLFGQRMEVSRGVLSSGLPQEATEDTAAGCDRLCVAGIKLDRGLELRQIDSIRLLAGEHRVYNFACPPIEAYIADGIVTHNCGFCAYRISSGLSNELFAEDGVRNPNRRIPTEKAIEIIDDCSKLGVQAIQFTGGGEPTVHKDHLKLFGLAQALGIKTALVTNGVRLDPDHSAVRAMKWVRVSIDAGTEETYCRIRRVPGNHWRAAWQNIRRLAETCEGIVSVGFVVTPENFTEVAAAASLARESGVKNMRVGAVFSSEGTGYYGDQRPAIRKAINDAKVRLNGDGFEIIDLFDRRMADLEAGSPSESLCGYQHLTTYIGGDLGVYRCCNTAYTRAGKVADLHQTRLLDVFAPSTPLPEFDARACRFCQFRGQNQVLAALVREPMHSEFV